MNRLCTYMGIAALAFLLVSASAWAQTDLDKRISIDVNTVAPREVFDSIARSLNCEAAVDPAVQQTVSLRVVNVRARTALSAICESISCQYRLEGKKLVIEPLRPNAKNAVAASRTQSEQLLQKFKKVLPQGLHFENAPLSRVLEALSDASGFEISTEPVDAERKVTADLSGLTIQEALKRVMDLAGTPGVAFLGVDSGTGLKIKIRTGAKKK